MLGDSDLLSNNGNNGEEKRKMQRQKRKVSVFNPAVEDIGEESMEEDKSTRRISARQQKKNKTESSSLVEESESRNEDNSEEAPEVPKKEAKLDDPKRRRLQLKGEDIQPSSVVDESESRNEEHGYETLEVPVEKREEVEEGDEMKEEGVRPSFSVDESESRSEDHGDETREVPMEEEEGEDATARPLVDDNDYNNDDLGEEAGEVSDDDDDEDESFDSWLKKQETRVLSKEDVEKEKTWKKRESARRARDHVVPKFEMMTVGGSYIPPAIESKHDLVLIPKTKLPSRIDPIDLWKPLVQCYDSDEEVGDMSELMKLENPGRNPGSDDEKMTQRVADYKDDSDENLCASPQNPMNLSLDGLVDTDALEFNSGSELSSPASSEAVVSHESRAELVDGDEEPKHWYFDYVTPPASVFRAVSNNSACSLQSSDVGSSMGDAALNNIYRTPQIQYLPDMMDPLQMQSRMEDRNYAPNNIFPTPQSLYSSNLTGSVQLQPWMEDGNYALNNIFPTPQSLYSSNLTGSLQLQPWMDDGNYVPNNIFPTPQNLSRCSSVLTCSSQQLVIMEDRKDVTESPQRNTQISYSCDDYEEAILVNPHKYEQEDEDTPRGASEIADLHSQLHKRHFFDNKPITDVPLISPLFGLATKRSRVPRKVKVPMYVPKVEEKQEHIPSGYNLQRALLLPVDVEVEKTVEFLVETTCSAETGKVESSSQL